MPRILAIRGGAIGDFVLTLPSIALLRDAFPAAQIEIVGYRHIVALAVGRGYASSSRSIEYAPMAGFFAEGSVLDSDLSEFFARFDQIVSWLYDPDGIFDTNLRRVGVKHLLHASPLIGDHDHAANQLARPLERLALYLEDPAARLHPTADDLADADRLLLSCNLAPPLLLAHPGSGSPAKCWPCAEWSSLLATLARRLPGGILIIGGEADQASLSHLRRDLEGTPGVAFAGPLGLTQVAALAARAGCFIGHDSGISHIAAAAGARCLLLFGPTDPEIWAPRNSGVRVLRAPGGDLGQLSLAEVLEAAERLLSGP